MTPEILLVETSRQSMEAWKLELHASCKGLVPGWLVGLTPDQALSSNRATWMVVPANLVSASGDDCDMIGTSFTAFRNQPVPGVFWKFGL